MRGKLWFLAGLGAGYVLGTRAGREKYEDLANTARKIKESPTVQEAAGVVQERASQLYTEGVNKVATSRIGSTRVGERLVATAQASRRPTTPPSNDPIATESTMGPDGADGTLP
jgi:hypothetical protein